MSEAELRRAPEVVIGTPGRLVDVTKNSLGVDIAHVEVLVLDEADRLLEMGFLTEVQFLLKSIREDAQVLLFSATVPAALKQLVSEYLDKQFK